MPRPVRALALPLRMAEYYLLLPFVFALTWLEAASEQTRENLAVGAVCVATMMACLCGVTIIRGLYT